MVLTGGPGAGKTAILELVRRTLCPHVALLPEVIPNTQDFMEKAQFALTQELPECCSGPLHPAPGSTPQR